MKKLYKKIKLMIIALLSIMCLCSPIHATNKGIDVNYHEGELNGTNIINGTEMVMAQDMNQCVSPNSAKAAGILALVLLSAGCYTFYKGCKNSK